MARSLAAIPPLSHSQHLIVGVDRVHGQHLKPSCSPCTAPALGVECIVSALTVAYMAPVTSTLRLPAESAPLMVVMDFIKNITAGGPDVAPFMVPAAATGLTTLHHCLADNSHGLAIIEYEFGDVGVDDKLVAGREQETNEDTIEVMNGCICCMVRGDLVNSQKALQISQGVRRRSHRDHSLKASSLGEAVLEASDYKVNMPRKRRRVRRRTGDPPHEVTPSVHELFLLDDDPADADSLCATLLHYTELFYMIMCHLSVTSNIRTWRPRSSKMQYVCRNSFLVFGVQGTKRKHRTDYLRV